jgi:uncharacterized membrane protein
MNMKITYYYRSIDDPDHAVYQHLLEQAQQLSFDLIDISLDAEPELINRFQEKSSFLQIGPYRLKFPFSDIDIQIAVNAYRDRLEKNSENQPVEPQPQKKKDSLILTGAEKFSYWLSNNYVWFFTVFLILFLGIPFLAPVLMEEDHPGPAHVIYSVYSIFCHQLAYRSYFFYGEQPYYPRELAGVPNVLTYEQITGDSALDVTYARQFTGNNLLGYKVALCERDVAIYASLILAGLIFQLSGKRIKQLPWYFWVILGVLPIALDGGSQLFSLGGSWPAWFPVRESTPLLRTVTGTLFGLFTGWYVYPVMEESMKEIRFDLGRKIALRRKLAKSGSLS